MVEALTGEQAGRFAWDGYLHLPARLSRREVDDLLAAVDTASPAPGHAFRPGYQDIVELSDVFARLIAHPAHVGIAYAFFGEMTKLVLSQFTVRDPKYEPVPWHHDGPRAMPYAAFSPFRPLVVKFLYWLTDSSAANTGELVVAPGSQLPDATVAEAALEASAMSIRCRAGDLVVMDTRVWHRTAPNHGLRRVAISLSYAPSWVNGQDSGSRPPDLLGRLDRTSRILLRSYSPPWSGARPPADDSPLVETGPPSTDYVTLLEGTELPPVLRPARGLP